MRLPLYLFCSVIMVLLAACAGERYHRQGLSLLAEGKPEEGVRQLEQAVKEDPTNAKFRADLLNRKAEQIVRLLTAADTERVAGRWDSAEAAYKRVLAIAPDNERAAAGLDVVARARRHAVVIEQAKETLKTGDAEFASMLLKPVLAEDPYNVEVVALKRKLEEVQTREKTTEPALRTNQKKPISLEFRDANLKMVLEALARTTGVNFILDKDVPPDLRTTVFLRQASLEDAIELILQTSRLQKKILNRNTILIYPNTPEKLKDYQELVVKGFYLSNADVKQTQTMIKGMLKTKDVFIDEKLNLLVMRDTPEAIRLAEKLIAMHDLYEPEVMLEVEVLEVKRSRLLELGIQWPNQLVLAPISTSGTLTLTDLKNLNSDRLSVGLPPAVVNLRRQIGDANILANPRIRARNREKAKIMIGDKVPVSTSTVTATGIVSENVQYLDVGIKLEVEPDVHLQDEVAIRVGLEVSSITNEVRTPGGSLAYQIGSRSASTVLRLKDGETQILGGLISDEDRMAANRVPGLGDIPILGRLFASQKDNREKTEIVLSITPRLVRNISRPDASVNEFWSGTESSLRTKPLTLSAMTAADELNRDASKNKEVDNKSTEEQGINLEPTEVSLNWQAPAQVKVGDQFSMALKLKSDGGLRSLPVQIGFDPTAFQVMNISEGPFFKRGDATTSMSSNVDPGAGRAFISVVRSGIDGARGDDTVAVLKLRAIAAKTKAEIKVLSSAPVSVGDKNITPILPAPIGIDISD